MFNDNQTSKLSALTMAVLLMVSGTVAVAAIGGTSAQQVGNAEQGPVTFSDQTTDGATVTVDYVNASDGGFVALHDASLLEGEVVGSVIGVSDYLEPGVHENVTVTLYDVPGVEFNQSELSANQTLIAMPHFDTNGNETYDFVATNGSEDGAYVANGSAVTDTANVTVQAEPTTGESFTVSNLSAPQLVVLGETVNVSATVTNPNDVAETQEVAYRFDGEVLFREPVGLDAGESTSIQVSVNSSEIGSGLFVHGVYTQSTGQPAQIRFVEEIQSFGVSNITAPDTVTVGENISVTATVDNPNDFPVEQQVEYRFVGDLLGVQNVSLDGGESTTVQFETGTEDLETGAYINSIFSQNFGQSTIITLEEADSGGPPEEPGNGTDAPDNGTDNETDMPDNETDVPDNGTDAIDNETDGTDLPDNDTDAPDNETDTSDNETEATESEG